MTASVTPLINRALNVLRIPVRAPTFHLVYQAQTATHKDGPVNENEDSTVVNLPLKRATRNSAVQRVFSESDICDDALSVELYD